MLLILEIVMVVALVGLVKREADARHENSPIWGGLVIVLYVLAFFFVPFVCVRVVGIAVVVFGAWVIYLSLPKRKAR